ncbi:MAG: hypothetical protein JST86_06595 [Bacteroidetes bacterium]|nr:hypothetical protein [Bacteroidota bacterium]
MSGIDVVYKELLSLAVEQPFYQNQYCKNFKVVPETDFLLVPTAECFETMNRLDMLWRPTGNNGGLTVFARVLGKNGGGDDLLRFKPGVADKLSFWMILKNPAAINFNVLPLQLNKNKLFYFTNIQTDNAAPRNQLHLTTVNSGADETKDYINKQPATYQYHHNANVAPGAAVVKHKLSGVAIAADTIINQGSSADIYFTLSSLPQGICSLLINNVETDVFYYMGNESPRALFGVIEFSLSALLIANYRAIEADHSLSATRPLYCIHFINRSTIWRYTLALQANSPLYLEWEALAPADKINFVNQLNIVTNDGAITFSQSFASPDGTSYQFVSNGAVALQEKYFSSTSITNVLSLSLKKYIGTPAVQVVRADLQCPSAGTIDAKNNPLIYSDILLTI